MSLDLKNVIGSFMLGSAIVYTAVKLIPQKNTCVSTKSKVALKLNSTKKSDLRLKTQPTFALILQPSNLHDKKTFDINMEGAYIDRNTGSIHSLITALAHVVWYKQKQSNDYVDFLTQFSKQFTLKLSLEDFISNYKLCKLKNIIFLHASKANSITFDTQNKGFYKGYITETTPYIVHVGNNFFPGVGKLNPQMIDLIKKTYTDITELQHDAPVEINCDGSVRFRL